MSERVFTDKTDSDAIILAEFLKTGETQARNDRNWFALASIPLIASGGLLLEEGIRNNSPIEAYVAEVAIVLGFSLIFASTTASVEINKNSQALQQEARLRAL